MGLFSKPKIPSIDTGALLRIQQENERKQKDIIGGLRSGLNPVNQNFDAQRKTLSAGVEGNTENVLNRYGQDISQVNAVDTAARNAANVGFREQAFREVPETQRAIRESLGGSGLLNSGAALSALSRPVLDASRSARDFTSANEVAGLAGAAGRSEKLADTGFSARSDAMKTKFGLDEGTINYLTSIGREDLIREAEGLLGVEEQSGANRLGIEQVRQESEMAKAAAKNARRTALSTSIGSLVGALAGSASGNPALGSQFGATLGNLAGGGTGSETFDPTLLYALGQRNRANISRSLGGGRSTPTISGYSSMVG